MRTKLKLKKKFLDLKNVQSLVKKNLNLNKFKLNPSDVIANTKNKIGDFYSNLKKQRENERK